ncbi:MAG TPA: VOC family protein [Bosea sp. (in: a-proteobacteria)]|jgi:catechol 2,3-dioxygenase-like lactoylglutathione lyase family enzyme|uniref:VOC family protein n=1 Tax=Bosea sp. (in: a-proteobacteria) TaxID=1871050 RepID=UPI002E143593|nr:VOC family protein [Bosea sp. (in: a-proteobacteria)]
MSLKHILGLDHVVVTVRDLDAAAEQWRSLGFTVSPRGTHSPILGTGNYTIMFGDDYVELLGILTETEQNKPTRDYLAKREGLERAAFTTDDAAAGAEELKSRGLAALGPIHFGRPVDLPGGGTGEARFNVFRWPLEEQPGGLRIFACQHLTRETVWIPELLAHANGASRLVRLEVLTADPKSAAEHLARLIDEHARADGDAWLVPSGGKRADFLFYDAAGFARRYPEAVRDGAATEGAVALVIASTNIKGAKASLGARAIAHDGAVSVAASAANGIVLSLLPQ